MRQHNSDILTYIIWGTFSIILLGAIIYYVFSNFKNTQQTANDIVENTNEILSESEDNEIKTLDGEELRGDQVTNRIKKWLGDYETTETAPIYVKVTTKVSGATYTNTYTNSAYNSEINNFSSAQYYIKPTAYYSCEVIKSVNKAVLGVAFKQK